MQDITHVTILAKQFSAKLKCDVAIVKEENKYNFYELNYAEKRKYKILDVIRVSTDEAILQDSGDSEPIIVAENLGRKSKRKKAKPTTDEPVSGGLGDTASGILGADEGQEFFA